MKTFILALALSMVFLSACAPSEDSDKKKTPREQSLENYLPHAKEFNRISKERAQPLAVSPLFDPSSLSNAARENLLVSLPQELKEMKARLERQVREAYGEEASRRAGDLILKYHKGALEAVKDAKSPVEVADKLIELDTQYQQHLQTFLQEEQAKTWVKPSPRQLERARVEMLARNEEILTDIRKYYGPIAAQKAKPALEQAVAEYLEVMETAKNLEEMDARTADISARSETRLQSVLDAFGDPLGVTSEEDIALMRAEMIAANQVIEKKIETLYGREATLQARKLFNGILEDATKVARTNTRVSYKREEINRLNKIYQDNMAKLQARFNKNLAEKAKPTRPPLPRR